MLLFDCVVVCEIEVFALVSTAIFAPPTDGNKIPITQKKTGPTAEQRFNTWFTSNAAQRTKRKAFACLLLKRRKSQNEWIEDKIRWQKMR